MAYVGTKVLPTEKEIIEASPLKVGMSVGKNIGQGLNQVNKVQERRLENFGWLDEQISLPPDIETGERDLFKVFERKSGKGAFRAPEDRLRLTDDAKKHFTKLSEESGLLPEEHIAEYIKGLGEGNENLINISEIGGEEGLKNKLAKKAEMTLSSEKLTDTQAKLMKEANIRGKEFVDKTMSAGFGGRTTGVGFHSDFMPSRGPSNIGIRPDLISGKKDGFGGIMPQRTFQGSENILMRPKTDLVGQNLMKQQARTQRMQGAMNLRDRLGQSPEIQMLKAIPQIGQGGMKTIGQQALKSMLPGLGTGASTAATAGTAATAAGLGTAGTAAGTAAGLGAAGTGAAAAGTLATGPVGWTILAGTILNELFG